MSCIVLKKLEKINLGVFYAALIVKVLNENSPIAFINNTNFCVNITNHKRKILKRDKESFKIIGEKLE